MLNKKPNNTNSKSHEKLERLLAVASKLTLTILQLDSSNFSYIGTKASKTLETHHDSSDGGDDGDATCSLTHFHTYAQSSAFHIQAQHNTHFISPFGVRRLGLERFDVICFEDRSTEPHANFLL